MKKNDKTKIVAVSGGFDPIHVGHIELLREAANLGKRLIVILNNDNWLVKKKGFVFMPEIERAEILRAIRHVNDVIITNHEANSNDPSVCQALRDLAPDIFANGGDRKADNIPEYDLCKQMGIKMIFNVGKSGKIQSASRLVEKARSHNRPS
jgi:cytidyltransferase-like protein